MKKNYVHNIVVHMPDNINFHTIADRISQFHFEIIERSINQANLTTEQKVVVIDRILEAIKFQEASNSIK